MEEFPEGEAPKPGSEQDPFRKKPKSLASRAVNKIAPKIVMPLVHYLQRKPIEKAERIGEKFGLLIMRFDGKHRNRAFSNLRLAFPEWGDAQVNATVREMFCHFGRVAADFTHIPVRSHQFVLDHSDVEGLEHLKEAQALGKGIIAITGHFGNWEWFGHWMAASGVELAVVARDANQDTLQTWMQQVREGAGTQVLSRGNAARGIITRLRANKLVGILPDQNSRDIYVPFFGQPAGTVVGPATFYEKLGAPVVPMFAIRLGPERYKMVFKPMLEPVPGYPVVEGMTRAINNALEEMIREVPSQWLWMHDRWKNARVTHLLEG